MNGRLERSNMGIEVKTGRIEQACARYGVGRSTMRQIAEKSGAIRRIGRNYLIDFQAVDEAVKNSVSMGNKIPLIRV